MVLYGMGWINLAQDRENWRYLVIALVSLGFCEMRRISRLARKLLDS